MKRIIGLLATAVILSAEYLFAGASTPGLKFETLRHDFGTIVETEGVVSHSFRYTNTSSQAVVIEEVTTTCGCTAADYTKRPIMPGESGSVCVRFDPTGRTNTFHKTLRVITARQQQITSLTVSGTILLSQPTDQILYELTDDLFAERLLVNFGTVRHGSPSQSQTVTLHNRSNREIGLQYGITGRSGCLKIALPARIASGATATMTVTLLDKPDYFGSVRDCIYLIAGNNRALPIQTQGDLVDNMQGVRVADSPICQITDGYFNFGQIRQSNRPEHTFTIHNRGKLPLVIRKIESQQPVTTDFTTPITLKTNENLHVKITVACSHLGDIDVNLRIITNDFHTPISVLKVEGTIR